MRDRVRSGKIKASEMRPRLAGFSIGPVQFAMPGQSVEEAAIARKVLAYLEDRRVLYVPADLEVRDHCIASVLDMRRFLTERLGELDQGSELAGTLRTIRAACRKFIEQVDVLGDHIHLPLGGYFQLVFLPAVGELRGITGVCVARIAEQYALDVEEPLSSILPAEPREED